MADSEDLAEYELPLDSNDAISRVRFAPFADDATRDVVAVSSWDSTVTVYNANPNVAKSFAKYKHATAALDCTFGATVHTVISGGLDQTLVMFDVTTELETKVGNHDKAIKCVEYNQETSAIITGSWDKTLKVWDTRIGNALVHTLKQPDKVFSMDLSGITVFVAHNGRHITMYDLRKLSIDPSHLYRETESPMQYQTRCISAFPDGLGYAIGSIEGRVAVEYFDVEGPKSKFAFRCHRSETEIFPVNAISFHPYYGTFATGGGDGLVMVWDAKNKKKLSQFKPYPTSIASLSFSSDGNKLAVASSYTFERGELASNPKDTLFIKLIKDEDVKPKPKKVEAG